MGNGLRVWLRQIIFQFGRVDDQHPVGARFDQALCQGGYLIAEQQRRDVFAHSFGQLARFSDQFKSYVFDFAFSLFGKDEDSFIFFLVHDVITIAGLDDEFFL